MTVFWLGSVEWNSFNSSANSVANNVELYYQIVTRKSRITVTIVAEVTTTPTSVTSKNNNTNKILVLNTFLYHRQVLDAWRWCPTQEPMMRSSPTTTELIKSDSYFRINKFIFIDLFLIRIYLSKQTTQLYSSEKPNSQNDDDNLVQQQLRSFLFKRQLRKKCSLCFAFDTLCKLRMALIKHWPKK